MCSALHIGRINFKVVNFTRVRPCGARARVQNVSMQQACRIQCALDAFVNVRMLYMSFCIRKQ